MKFSLSTSVLAIFVFSTSVLADTHPNCACNNDGSYNWRMTTVACTVYNDAKYQWGGASYDAPSGRCVAASGAAIAGDQWQEACQSVSKSGFQCVSGQGTCYADANSVKGDCAK